MLVTLCCLISLVSATAADTTHMRKMLDDMADFYKKGDVYDPEYFEELTTCMAKYDDDLLIPSQDAAWKGMLEYFQSNGVSKDYMNKTDHWGECTPYINDTRCPVGPYERNSSATFGVEKMTIYEPCNYVSNVAYYRSATRICDYPDWSIDTDQIKGLKRSFATLAMGSAMWHGSHTYVGYSFDNNMIAVISYLAHQAAVSSLPGNSTVLKQLSLTPRSMDGVEVSEDLVRMFSEKEVPQWAELLDNADLPHVYFITFAALIATGFSLMFPWFITEFLISKLCAVLIPDETSAKFIDDHYLPELGAAVANIKVAHEDAKELGMRFIGMLIKIGWAFTWQEFFIPVDFLYNPLFNGIGAAITPDINEFSTRISRIPQTDQAVVNSVNIYPGEDQCKGFSPHSLWHEESANGLLEIVFLGDFMNKILTKTKVESPHMFVM